jgi:hypothetical protein
MPFSRRFYPKRLTVIRPKTDFHRSNVHCSGFLAKASLIFLLVCFSTPVSGVSLQKFDHEGLIHAVSSEQLMLKCVCYLNSVRHLFGLQFLKLVTITNVSCAAEVTLVLPFLCGPHKSQFHNSTWWFLRLHLKDTLNVLKMFRIDWPLCLKVMMDCCFSLLIWAVLAIQNLSLTK